MHNILFEEVGSFEGYKNFLIKNQIVLDLYNSVQKEMTESNNALFEYNAFCTSCDKIRPMKVDQKYSHIVSGNIQVNWRERQVCSCGLNSRLRASIHFVKYFSKLEHDAWIYIAEQVTPLYNILTKHYSNTIGSEYLYDQVPFGCHTKEGIRNETATKLTFHDNSFKALLSFDVLEHIPDYNKALKEAYRVLAPSGFFIFSVPFNVNSQQNIVRAKLDNLGNVVHILPAEYHGNPLNSKDGSLCFYHFGWNLLEELRNIGFQRANAHFYLSKEYGYLGNASMIFCAIK